MVNQQTLYATLAFITPGIMKLLMDNRKITEQQAASLLYNSNLYKVLEDEQSKLWRLSFPILYDLLEEELATGVITWPEEQ